MANIKFYLETDFPLAKDSLDYQYPEGAIQDNSKRPKFNEGLKRYPGSVLDLGCAGGGFIKDCIDEGRIAVGLEGTDFNKNGQKFEWATIPDNLFTCDLTKPFVLHTGDRKCFQFNIVTAWEFFEHIEKPDIAQLILNIKNHLTDGGLLICSIDGNHYPLRHHREIDLHRTVESKDWWLGVLETSGFKEDMEIAGHFAGRWLRESRSPKNYRMVLRKNG